MAVGINVGINTTGRVKKAQRNVQVTQRRHVLAPDVLVLLCGVVAAMHVGKLPTALPVLRDTFGLSLVESGFLLSLVQAAAMTLALAVGLAVDRMGLRAALLVGLVTLAAASAAGSAAQSAAALAAWRATEGLGFLFVTLAAPALIRRLVPAERINERMGWWGAYMPSGTALALVGGPWIMAAGGWSGWWMVLAGLAALAAAWSAYALPPESTHLTHPTPSHTSWAAPVRDTITARGPWLLALTFAAYSSQWLTVIGFLPTLYADAGIAASTAGLLTAGVALANVLGNVASGRLLQRGVPRLMLLWTGFATMACGAFVAFGLEAQTSPGMRYVAVWLFSAVGGLIPGTLFATAVHVAPNERALPTVMGWLIQWSAVGQFVGPPLAAWWTSHHGGWSTTWVTTGSAAVLGAVLSLAVARVHGAAQSPNPRPSS